MSCSRPVLLALLAILVGGRALAADPVPGVGQACQQDADCPRRTICDMEHRRCERIRRQINLLYLVYCSADRRFTQVMGLYWHKKGEAGYRVLFPLYWSFWSQDGEAERRHRMVVPFYFDHRDGDRRTTVVPPVEVHREPGERTVRVWPLVFHTAWDRSGHSTTVVPFAHYSRVGSRRTFVLPPLLSYLRTDDEQQLSQGAVGGLFYWKREQDREAYGLVPLFYHRRSPGRRFSWIAPLTFHWRRDDPASSTLLALPVLMFHRDPWASTTLGLVPPLYVHLSQHRTRVYLPPVTFYRRTGEDWLLTLGPTWIHSGPGGSGFGLPPLVADWTPRRRLVVLFPALWHLRRPQQTTWVVGPAYYHRHGGDDGERLSLGLAPLLFYRERPGFRSVTALPLFSMQSWAGRRRLFVSPLGAHEGDGERTQLVLAAPPYYMLRDRKLQLDVDLAPPLFARWRDGRARSSTLLAGPLLLHDSPRTSAQVGFPLLWRVHNKTDNSSSTLLLPLGFHRRHPAWGSLITVGPSYLRRGPRGWDAGLVPLAFAGRRDEERYLALPPLVWGFRNPERQTWVVGSAYYHRHRQRLSFGLAPLLFYRERPGFSSTVALPLFSLQSWAGRRRLFVSPLGAYEGDGERTQLVLAAPPYYMLRDRKLQLDVDLAPPLFARWRDGRRRSSTLLAGPLLLHDSPRTGVQVGFPLLWRVHNKTDHSTSTLLLPLGFHHRHPEWGSLVTVGPTFFHRGPRGWDAGLVPLAFAGRRDQERYLALPPLVWGFSGPQQTVWFVGPGYYLRKAKLDQVEAGVVPLVFYRRGSGERTLTVLPLFHHRRATGKERFLSPLFLYDHDRAAGRRQWALLAPLYYHRRDSRWSVDTLPPLFTRVVDAERRRSLVLGGPLALYRSEGLRARVLFPLAWDLDRGAEGRTTLVLPLFLRRRWADGSTLTLVGPGYWRRRADGWNAGLAPLVFAGRRGDRRHRVVFPAFWQLTAPQRSFTLAGPVLWHRRGEDVVGGLLPLGVAGRWNGARFVTVPPLLFHTHHAADTAFTWAGLYTYRRTPGAVGHSLWPLFHYRRSGEPPEHRTVVGLVPLFRYRREPGSRQLLSPLGGFSWSAESTTAVVGPVYVHRGRTSATAALIPLAFASWERGRFAEQHRMGVLPLFYRAKGPGHSALYTPLFGVRRRPGSTLWYAGNLLAYRSPATSLSLALPLALHHRDHQRGRTTVVALPGYVGRWSAERSSHTLAPLFWHRRGPAGSTTVLAPALWDVHHRGVSRSTVLFPLYLRHRNELARTTTHLTHLVWVRRHGEGTDAVAFPVLWHFSGARRRSTVLFPLVWDFARDRRRSTVVLPVYWDFTRRGTRTTVVLNTIYRRTKGQGTYDFHFLPLVHVQRKRPQDFKLSLVAGMFGYERIGLNRQMKLLFIPFELKPGT